MNFAPITRAFAKIGRVLKNAAPEIAIVTGTVGLIAAGVVACKETPKAIEAINDHKEHKAAIAKAAETGKTENGKDYDAEDKQKDTALIFVQDGLRIVKTYAPAIALATVSVALIFTGGKIFRKRLVSITGAYALLESNFEKYRKGVVDKFGKEVDQQLRYGTEEVIQEVEKTDADGNTTTEVEAIKKTSYDGYSDYARFFDETNPNWVKDGARNLSFLQARQAWLNDKLREKRVLFLNEVYKDLGIPRTPEGQLVGWIYDPADKSIDSYVDFGLMPIIRDKAAFEQVQRDQERSFLLDFNCDGRILEKLKKYERNF